MSSASQPGAPVGDERREQVVVISHSPLFYWWPVWVVGFLMAGVSYWRGQQVAFVPTGTVAERAARVEGIEGKRDILVAPAGQPLPAASESDELKQPRMRMTVSNNPGVIWVMTFCIVIVITHVQLRGMWSLIALIFLGGVIGLFAALGLWDPILRSARVIDIHINALGYLSISFFLFVIWLVMFLVVDRLKYMIFTRGGVRVRTVIGEGEKFFDTRGIVFKRHRDDLFRHWLLGFGTADLTVFTSGANSQQMEMPNVLGIGRKLAQIHTLLQEREVVRGSR
jgi:hypothetical protein